MFKEINKVFDTELANQLEHYVANAPLAYIGETRQDTGFTHWRHAYAPGDEANGLDVSKHLPPIVAEAWRHLQSFIGFRCFLCFLSFKK